MVKAIHAALVVACAIALSALVAPQFSFESYEFVNPRTGIQTREHLRGTIVFSGASEERGDFGVYAYNVKTRALGPVDRQDHSFNISVGLDHGGNLVFASRMRDDLSPDGEKELILKEDGLYIESRKDGALELLHSSSGEANMHFALSKSGRYLAVSFPERREVIIMSMRSWDSLDMEFEVVLPLKSAALVFSTDESHIAALELRRPSRKGEFAVISVWNIESGTAADIISLYPYENSTLDLLVWQP